MPERTDVDLTFNLQDIVDSEGKSKIMVDMTLRGDLVKLNKILRDSFGFNPFSHLIDELKHELESLAGDLKGGLEATANTLKEGLESEAKTLESGLDSTAKTLEGNLEDVYGKLKDDLESDVKTVLEAILSEIEKGVLGKAVDVIKRLLPNDFSIGLGPLTVDIGDIQSKVDTLSKYVDNPPNTQDAIIDFLKVIEPDSVQVSVGVQLSEIFVTSSDESLQFSASWDFDDFIDAAEDIFKLIA